MKLKPRVASLKELPPQLADFYAAGDDGSFVIDLESAEGLELGDVAGAREEAERLWCALEKRIRSDAISQALLAAGANQELLEPHLARRIRVDRKSLKLQVVNASGHQEINLKGEDASVVDLVEEYRGNRAFRAAFSAVAVKAEQPKENLSDRMRVIKAQRASAASAPSPASLDPHTPDFNLTAAMQFARNDPARSAELSRNLARRS